jgi:Uma2 family endonuclease
MTTEHFVLWAETRRDKAKWELFDGASHMQAAQTYGHVRAKFRLAKALDTAIVRAGLNAFVGVDGLVMKIDAATAYEPDVLVCGGPEMADSDIIAPNPIIAAEVLSPSSLKRDMSDKLAGYFRAPSIVHSLIVDPDEKRVILHHQRAVNGLKPPRIVVEGDLTLDPPGLAFAVSEIFG